MVVDGYLYLFEWTYPLKATHDQGVFMLKSDGKAWKMKNMKALKDFNRRLSVVSTPKMEKHLISLIILSNHLWHSSKIRIYRMCDIAFALKCPAAVPPEVATGM